MEAPPSCCCFGWLRRDARARRVDRVKPIADDVQSTSVSSKLGLQNGHNNEGADVVAECVVKSPEAVQIQHVGDAKSFAPPHPQSYVPEALPSPSAGRVGRVSSTRSDVNRVTSSPSQIGRISSARPEQNGFRALPDLKMIHVEADRLAPFTLPEEAVSFEPSAAEVVSRFANGDSERLIHCNVKLRPEEERLLKMMQQEARKKGLAFLPSISLAATRYLSDARNDYLLALQRMQAAQEWRIEYVRDGPITDKCVAEDMKHGVVYFAGRDRALRPALVVRPGRTPTNMRTTENAGRLTKLLVFCMEYLVQFMTIPGCVENLSVILDLKGLAVSQIPLSALLEIKTLMSQQYTGRVYKFYICNMPWVLRAMTGIVQAAMTDRQREKMMFVRSVEELQRDFALHQLEEDLGGSRPIASTFFPFPLPAGPFQAGYSNGPNPAAIRHVHRLISSLGTRGRLWDPRKSREENTRPEYADDAADLLQSCGVVPSVPSEPCKSREMEKTPEYAWPSRPAEDANAPRKASSASLIEEMLSAGISRSRSTEGDKYAAPSISVDDESSQVRTVSIFSCGMCECRVVRSGECVR